MAELSPPTRESLRRAEAIADEMGHPLMGTEHLLLAIVESDDGEAAHRILRETGPLKGVEAYLKRMFRRSNAQRHNLLSTRWSQQQEINGHDEERARHALGRVRSRPALLR